MVLGNRLTTEVGFKVGPVLLEVLAKHYLDRPGKDGDENSPKLRKDDILYDEAFTIVKAFLNAASWHTVEDLQAFSNTRTPSPPWVHVFRTTVPMSCCDEAASYLISALGGEDVCRRVVGGVKWWQVRGIDGVDAQWIAAKKDWREAKRRFKQRGEKYSTANEEGTYAKDMDAMRCILYLHGGGYYFGSVDQERYSIQRLARKINGRVFAINYRLAPQYPFPCALQDALASYLYLIRPPTGAEHQAVDPAHIVIAGDSAGGGLSLALLQVIRDTGLPAPAGGILISPWCDLTHSFPSIHLNTKTDVIPDCGLSFHKPSPLWPPPPPEISDRVHASIRHRLRQVFNKDDTPAGHTDTIISHDQKSGIEGLPVDVGTTTAVPEEQTKLVEKMVFELDNETVEIESQFHFYTRNSLLVHPLVSSAMSYLGDLPPLFFIASDKEVLRDEIIYTAHRAADPAKFPVQERCLDLYPTLRKYKEMKPTSVHLQVYDDTAHVLPILFAFTTPAKFCFRAMANFAKLVTGMPLVAPLVAKDSFLSQKTDGSKTNSPVTPSGSRRASLSAEADASVSKKRRMSAIFLPSNTTNELSPARPSLRRSLSARLGFGSPRNSGSPETKPQVESPPTMSQQDLVSEPKPIAEATGPQPSRGETTASDVAGPRFSFSRSRSPPPPGERYAGEVSFYQSIKNPQSWECGMVRERVSTEGIIRPLEPASELEAMQIPDEILGRISELAVRRYLDSQKAYDKKFAHTYKQIEKHRRRNLERAKQDTIKRMSKIKKSMRDRELKEKGKGTSTGDSSEKEEEDFKAFLLSTPGWSCAWALDEGEMPPPSSIVARRDTEEARQLAEFADRTLLGGERDHAFSGNNLWSVVINFFTVNPDRSKSGFFATKENQQPESSSKEEPRQSRRAKLKSKFMPFHGHHEKPSDS
ncbi:lipase/esterase [Coprinopsis cinerea okayama7|uniref:Lipase/esterase n=1 Tax=Coprinopsis cinerea (strain Okayama-7 / 130 / ATCC MYA-4618 / FGSC 9003) TaxID=240176 RepID=A8N720_COPC7|nr:lipase/esterase [Coprinopsis cinerea okayama7\|eukprot:XP_001830626.2 lipase/esterase [Coprinopsis cinerea okayama7\